MLRVQEISVQGWHPSTFRHEPAPQRLAILQRFHDPVEVRLDGVWRRLEAGASLVCPPGCGLPHRAAGRPFRGDWILVAGPLAEAAAAAGCPLRTPLAGRADDGWGDCLCEIHRERGRQEPGWERIVDHRLQDLLVHLARLADRHAPADPVVAQVRRRVQGEPERRWTIAEMAALARISASRFGVRYRLAFGVSPLEDLLRMRIARAEGLLRDTGLPVSLIAGQCGFRDPAWFHRCFRRHRGRTPQQVRRQS